MAALKPYYYGPNMLQNAENYSIEDRAVDNHLEKKYILMTLWRSLLVFPIPANFDSNGTSHKPSLAAKYSLKWWPPKLLQFLQEKRCYISWHWWVTKELEQSLKVWHVVQIPGGEGGTWPRFGYRGAAEGLKSWPCLGQQPLFQDPV